MNFMLKPSQYKYIHMQLELDWELSCYKQEAVQVAWGMVHQATAYSDLMHL